MATLFAGMDAASRTERVRAAMLLYAVPDRAWCDEPAAEGAEGEGAENTAESPLAAALPLVNQVKAALEGGVTCVHLREKTLDDALFLEEELRLSALCHDYNVPLIINDNIGVALACGADGVHVGQDDMPCAEVRALVGPDVIVGVSVHTVAEALAAKDAGADYLGVGAMHPPATKDAADGVTIEELREICATVDIPVVAIGGMNAQTIGELAGTGTDGVACVSAIFAANDIERACCELREKAETIMNTKPQVEGRFESDASSPSAPSTPSPLSAPCRFTAAVFDFDGTLFDSMPAWENASNDFLAQQGRDAEEDLWERFRKLTVEQAAEYIGEHYHLGLTIDEISEGVKQSVRYAYANTIQPKPGVVALIGELRARGVKCAIATASDHDLIESAVTRCGIDDLFEEIFTCDELHTSKREPLIYRTAMERLGGTYENTVIFEDAQHCIETCKADGFIVCAIADSSEEDQAYLARIADCHLDTFAEPAAFWALAEGRESGEGEERGEGEGKE